MFRYEATDEEIAQLKAQSYYHDYTHYIRYDNPCVVYTIHEYITYNMVIVSSLDEYVDSCTFLLRNADKASYKRRLLEEHAAAKKMWRSAKIAAALE